MFEAAGGGHIRDPKELIGHVGGVPEATRYDPDATMFVNDMGRVMGEPMNTRATDYIRNHTYAARHGRMDSAPPDYGLYGDVVVVGGNDSPHFDVPDRLVNHFAFSRDAQDPTLRPQTEGLRAEVRAAYDEWMRDRTVWENEREYFVRLDKLDATPDERGLECGDDIDEEVPLGTSLGERSYDRSDDRDTGWGR